MHERHVSEFKLPISKKLTFGQKNFNTHLREPKEQVIDANQSKSEEHFNTSLV